MENSPGESHYRQAGPPRGLGRSSLSPGGAGRRQSGTRTLPGATRQSAPGPHSPPSVTSCCSHSRKKLKPQRACPRLLRGAAPVLSGAGWVFSLGLRREGKGCSAPGWLSQPGPGYQARATAGPWKATRRAVSFRQALTDLRSSGSAQFLWVSCPQQHDPGTLP